MVEDEPDELRFLPPESQEVFGKLTKAGHKEGLLRSKVSSLSHGPWLFCDMFVNI